MAKEKVVNDNKITETVKLIAGEDKKEPPTVSPATNVILDSSTPSVRSIVRVVLITLIIIFISDSIKGIITSLTYLFF